MYIRMYIVEFGSTQSWHSSFQARRFHGNWIQVYRPASLSSRISITHSLSMTDIQFRLVSYRLKTCHLHVTHFVSFSSFELH